jgi:dTDP-4-amino-4,6-dideoxygalactose transaminase
MGIDPFKVVRDFEAALCDYTGAKYAVTVTSCTSAILLACGWLKPHLNVTVKIPSRTYVGVAQSILGAGFALDFHPAPWRGGYQLWPLPVFDYARRFTSGMYRPGEYQCVSFHPTKILGLSGYGGAILHDSDDADEWLRRARFDGRVALLYGSRDSGGGPG